MVVKLETVAALYADVYPTIAKSRSREECISMDCPRRQKLRCTALPALVEDDSEVEAYEPEPRSFIMHGEGLRRQKSLSPQRRERMRRQLALPSLSEDEEPWSTHHHTRDDDMKLAEAGSSAALERSWYGPDSDGDRTANIEVGPTSLVMWFVAVIRTYSEGTFVMMWNQKSYNTKVIWYHKVGDKI